MPESFNPDNSFDKAKAACRAMLGEPLIPFIEGSSRRLAATPRETYLEAPNNWLPWREYITIQMVLGVGLMEEVYPLAINHEKNGTPP